MACSASRSWVDSSDQVETLNALNHQASQARDMIYGVTAQSHYRAMALPGSTIRPGPRRSTLRRTPSPRISATSARTAPRAKPRLAQVEATNEVYATSSDAVTELFNDDKIEQALALHIDQEHEILHDLEAHLGTLIADSEDCRRGDGVVRLEPPVPDDRRRRLLRSQPAHRPGRSGRSCRGR